MVGVVAVRVKGRRPHALILILHHLSPHFRHPSEGLFNTCALALYGTPSIETKILFHSDTKHLTPQRPPWSRGSTNGQSSAAPAASPLRRLSTPQRTSYVYTYIYKHPYCMYIHIIQTPQHIPHYSHVNQKPHLEKDPTKPASIPGPGCWIGALEAGNG